MVHCYNTTWRCTSCGARHCEVFLSPMCRLPRSEWPTCQPCGVMRMTPHSFAALRTDSDLASALSGGALVGRSFIAAYNQLAHPELATQPCSLQETSVCTNGWRAIHDGVPLSQLRGVSCPLSQLRGGWRSPTTLDLGLPSHRRRVTDSQASTPNGRDLMELSESEVSSGESWLVFGF